MDTRRIAQILSECAGAMRKDGTAHEECEVVDVWVRVPLYVAMVREHEQEMIRLLQDWPIESWGHSIPPLGDEISYIQAGGVLGDQGLAFQLFAYGKLLNWWAVMEPCSMLNLTKDDKLAQEMVGMGYVSILGYAPIPEYVE